MTLAQLRTLLGQLLDVDLDNYAGDAPSTSDLNGQINRAIRIISRHVRPIEPKVALTILAADQEIPFKSPKFARKMMSIDRIFRSAGVEIFLYPKSQFDTLTDWRFASSGTPQAATVSNNTLRFDKPWASGTTLYVEGQVFYNPLVNDSDEPEFDEYAHEAVAYLAAEIAAQPLVSETTALNRLSIYEKIWFKDIDELRSQVGGQNHDLMNDYPARVF